MIMKLYVEKGRNSLRIDEYEVIETFFQNDVTIIYKALSSDNIPVAIKTVANPSDINTKNQLYKEFAIAKGLNEEFFGRYIQILELDRTYLVMSFEQGKTIPQIMDTFRKSEQDFLQCTFLLASALESLHSKRIIHLDLRPSNIICLDDISRVKILDFGKSSYISSVKNFSLLPEISPYSAPEQTGLTSKSVDERSDLYSLGVILYEIIGYHPPFVEEDPLKLAHAHVAKNPPPLNTRNVHINPTIEKIILKLLAKDQDDRYQNATSLKLDIERLLKNPNISFEPGDTEEIRKFLIPQKLYGRDSELQTFHDIISSSLHSKPSLFMVKGYSGIGKTSFINEVIPMVLIQDGLFLKGKFDQYNRNNAYGAFLSVFSNFIHHVNQLSNEIKIVFIAKLKEELGDSVVVLSKIFPDFEVLFGSVSDISIEQSLLKNQLLTAVERLFNVITTYKTTVVIFLDDMQWVDSASLELLQMIVTSNTIHGMSVIGAYRSNEVELNHPLVQTLDQISKNGVSIATIELSPLNEYDTQQMLFDTLKRDDIKELAKIVIQKTEGNPFFIRQFLQTLYREKLIVYSTSSSEWEWKTDLIEQKNITNNVLEHLMNKIATVSETAKEFLKSASVIGDRFNVEVVIHLNSLHSDVLKQVIRELSNEGLVDFDFSDVQTHQESAEILPSILNGHFVHDKIRQASYMLMSEQERLLKHFNIANDFLISAKESPSKSVVLYAAGHIVEAKSLLQSSDNRGLFIDILYKASTYAKESLAYSEALKYINTAISFLDDSSWNLTYRLTFDLYLAKISILRLNTQYEEASQLFQVLFANSGISDLDIGKLYNEELIYNFSQGFVTEALLSGLQALDTLGFSIPQNETDIVTAKNSEIDWLAKRIDSLDRLKEMPNLSDEKIELCMNILMNMGIPAFVSRQDIFGIIALRMARLSFEYGVSPVSSYGFALSGMIMGAGMGRYPEGYKLGQSAMVLQERFNNKAIECKLLRVYGAYVSSWFESHEQTLETLKRAYASGIENGDYAYAIYCLNHIFTREFLLDVPLDILLKKTDSFMSFIEGLHDTNISNIQKILVGTTACLMGQTLSSESISFRNYDEKESLSQLIKSNYKTGLAYYYIYKLQICYLHELYEKAIEYAEIAEGYLANIKGNILESEWAFYYSLSVYKLHRQQLYGEKLTIFLEKFAQWSVLNRMNFEPKFFILKAMQLFEIEQFDTAFSLFDNVLEAQEKNPLSKALTLELIAECWRIKKNHRVAVVYLEEAHKTYYGCKAYVKAKMIMNSHLLKNAQSIALASSGSNSSEARLNAFDEATISKATFAMTGKIERSGLIEVFLKIISQNFGAQIGGLILKENDRYYLEGTFNIDSNPQINLQQTPLEGIQELPVELIKSAILEKNTIIFGDLKEDELFSQDPIVLQRNITSVICAPMFLKDQFFGLVYLENNLVKNFFDSSRQNILNIILTQTALTLELEELYNRDKLTGCYSRQKLDEILTTNDYHSLAILNIDDFDSINSTFGYVIGDEVLRLFVAFINELIPIGSKLFRFGGDEFVIICFRACELESVAYKITEQLKTKKFNILDISMHISCTIGIADTLLTGLDSPFVQAHAAMKEMKQASTHKYYKFSAESTYLSKQKHARDWTSKVREAIDTDNFIPYFQPIVNNLTQKIERYECLARLRDHDKIITPYHFIEPAKFAGLLPKITEIMLVKSFETFQNTNYGFSINITEDDLQEGYLPGFLKKLLETYTINPNLVSLEILENVSAHQSDYVLEQLIEIKKLGFKIALDDFGSENSNLFKLQKLNVDFIKIDGSFIKDININSNSLNICKTIVYLAESLNCTVIAEFVHSKEVFEKVCELNIPFSQGYYFGEPKEDIERI